MCIIERFNLIHPNGAPERKENLIPCEFGSPFNPCNNTRIQPLQDYIVPRPEPALGSPRYLGPNPRHPLRPSRQEETRRLKKFSNNLKLVWDFHIPFTSRKSDKKRRSTSGHASVRRGETHGRDGAQYPIPSQPHMAPDMHWLPQQGGPHVVHVPDAPQQPTLHGTEPRTIRPRRKHPLNVQVHQAGDSSSPSPPTPLREHRRHRPHTPPEVQRYEELKRQVREKEAREHAERQRRERAERHARDAEEARRRAEREAERIRRRQNVELANEERRRIEQEEQTRIQATERRLQEREERLRAQEQEERRRRRRTYLDDQQRIESLQAGRRRREQEEREREYARAMQEAEDRQRLQEEAIRDTLHRDRDERARLDRQRRAGIPRRPRHEAELHHRPNVSFEDRGDQVIGDAIRAEDERRFQGRAPAPGRGWPRRRDVGGGLRRRDTIAVTQRRVYDDDQRRAGGRFI